MKRVAWKTTALTFLLLMAAGCDDDNDNPVIVDRGADYLIVGEVILRPYVDFLGNIHPIYGQENEIDSILFDTTKCTIAKHPSFVDGNNYTYGFSYFNPADSTRFHSGDTVRIKFFKGYETAVASVRLLEVLKDTIHIVSPGAADTTMVGEDLVITWNKVEGADWYSVYYVFDTSLVFGAVSRQVYDYAADTGYTISGEGHPTDGEYHVFITANTGPIPGSGVNISSKSMTGTIYGSSQPGVPQPLIVIVSYGLD
jgi:hypothetical protein